MSKFDKTPIKTTQKLKMSKKKMDLKTCMAEKTKKIEKNSRKIILDDEIV